MEDLDKRHHLQELIEQRLQADGIGEVDGGDIGSGTANIYLEDVADPGRAVKAVVAALTDAQALAGTVIAQTRYSGDEESEDRDIEGYTVLWPSDYQGEFDIW